MVITMAKRMSTWFRPNASISRMTACGCGETACRRCAEVQDNAPDIHAPYDARRERLRFKLRRDVLVDRRQLWLNAQVTIAKSPDAEAAAAAEGRLKLFSRMGSK